MFLPFLVGYGLAVRQCHAELMATESWLQDEVAELRKELAVARAELHRLRATQTRSSRTATSVALELPPPACHRLRRQTTRPHAC